MNGTWLALIPVCAFGQVPDIRIDVDLVTVPCSVTTRSGAPVGGLTAADFRLLDDGEPREIRQFWREQDLPLTIALVADVSGSQLRFVRSHREALTQFLTQVIGQRDRAMVVQVAAKSSLLSGLAGPGSDLVAAIEKVGTREGEGSPLLGPVCRNKDFPHSCGGTALWHALYYTARELKSVPGRKAIVVMSDGMDTGSDIRLNDVIEAAESGGIVVYSIKYASAMRFVSVTGAMAQAASRGLERLSRETGGMNFGNPGRQTDEVFSRIESDLRNMYVLGFSPPEARRDGLPHKLAATTPGKDLEVRSRDRYTAAHGESGTALH